MHVCLITIENSIVPSKSSPNPLQQLQPSRRPNIYSRELDIVLLWTSPTIWEEFLLQWFVCSGEQWPLAVEFFLPTVLTMLTK